MPNFALFPLDRLFDLRWGDYHSLSDELDAGRVPVVSCGDSGNGIIGEFDAKEGVYRDALTVAFNARPLTTKIHPYGFAAKDDVAVATPKLPLPPPAFLFIQATLNAERWRFSYYRKCFREKLGRFQILLPATSSGEPDVDFMASAVSAQPLVVPRAPIQGVVPCVPLTPPSPEMLHPAHPGRGSRSSPDLGQSPSPQNV